MSRISEEYNFGILYPELSDEWNFDKNKKKPNQYTPSSHSKVWWICTDISDLPCGNEWLAEIVNRTKKGSGCPYCSGRTVHTDGRNSMIETHPELAEQFHPTKNGIWTPENLMAGTNKKLHWICKKCTHEWVVSGNKRTSGGTQCPSCTNKSVNSNDARNSMRNLFPKVSSEFHISKNGIMTPDNLVPGTNKKIWWVCNSISKKPCGNEWRTSGDKRCFQNTGCPVCSHSLVHPDGRNSMMNTKPDLALDFHLTKNGDITPLDIFASTHKKFWWLCSTCEHEWKAERSSGQKCPACINLVVHSRGINSMRKTHPNLAQEFHPTKNGKMNPDNTLAKSDKKIWWVCTTISKNPCGNEWLNTGRKRSSQQQGCNVCVGKKVHVDGRNSMKMNNPDLASDFHPTKNGNLTSENTLSGTHKKLWWLCSTCEHEWEADRHSGNKCPACARQVVHSNGNNSMRNTHPKLAEEFHPTKNGDLTPDNLLSGTNIKIWWKCSECSYVWDAVGASRLDKTHQKGSNCPSCAPSGFDGSKPGYLYALHYKTAIDEWYKVGITNNEVRYRVNQLLLSAKKSKMYYDAEITILEEIYFEQGRDAEDLERKIKKEMKEERLKFIPSDSISGKYEFVITHPLEFARARGWF
jgi:hypothetical protein